MSVVSYDLCICLVATMKRQKEEAQNTRSNTNKTSTTGNMSAAVSQKTANLQNGQEEEDPELAAEREYERVNGVSAAPHPSIPMSPHDAAKMRTQRRTFSVNESSSTTAAPNGVVSVPKAQKNARKSRAKTGRGDAKKEGGGGKYVWGKPTDVYEDESIDEADPNYDSDTAGADVTFDELSCEMQIDKLPAFVEPLFDDYFASGDLREMIQQLSQLGMSSECAVSLVRILVASAVDHKANAREMASQLLADIVSRRIVSQKTVLDGFERVLNDDLPDLVVDCPLAGDIVGRLMARAVADLALHKQNVYDMFARKQKYSNAFAQESLEKAETLLEHPQLLHEIWGVSGGQRPVRQLQQQMKLVLQEFLSSSDLSEAGRCLRELNVPHFTHEFVYQAGVYSIESMHQRVCDSLARLLAHLHKEGELSDDSISMGFNRLYDDLADICVDVPCAYAMCERWVTACRAHRQLLPDAIARRMPHRGRKRFLSEGDGGRLSVTEDEPSA